MSILNNKHLIVWEVSMDKIANILKQGAEADFQDQIDTVYTLQRFLEGYTDKNHVFHPGLKQFKQIQEDSTLQNQINEFNQRYPGLEKYLIESRQRIGKMSRKDIVFSFLESAHKQNQNNPTAQMYSDKKVFHDGTSTLFYKKTKKLLKALVSKGLINRVLQVIPKLGGFTVIFVNGSDVAINFMTEGHRKGLFESYEMPEDNGSTTGCLSINNVITRLKNQTRKEIKL